MMTGKTKNKSIVWDVVAAVSSLVVTICFLVYFEFDVAVFSLAVVVFISGWLRAKNDLQDTKTKLLILCGHYLIFLLPVMNGVFHLLFIPFVAFLSALVGVYGRKMSALKPIRSGVIIIGYFAFVYFTAFLLIPVCFNNMMWQEEYSPAPSSYKMLTAQGDTIRSSDLKGQIVVLDFWATWCGPCIAEFPSMVRVCNTYKNNEANKILLVNSTLGGDTPEKAFRFISKKSYDLPFAVDINKTTSQNFGIKSLPTIVVIDKRGIIRYRHVGFDAVADFESLLKEKLDSLLVE